MTIESDIKTVLDDYSGLSALVGSRNYGSRLPTDPTYPNVVFSRVSTNPIMELDGRNPKGNAIFQFDCRDTTYNGVRAVATQVIAAIEATTTFVSVLQTDIDLPYDPEVFTYRSRVSFSLWFN